MDALDLTKAPPRPPREPLAGLDLIMAARTVDKLRASLPGGNLGAYQLPGFSTQMLEAIGVGEDDLRSAVARASSDAEIAAWLRERVPAEKIAAFNAAIVQRCVKHRLEDEAWRKKYAHAVSLPPETPLIDMLSKDDELAFLGAR
ncbi:MAG TPA: DUF5069 domain-containing protein [Candidatus Acidoferrales bacterium]|nr:DUF5069 domain-containing protein [Candidatus Acidoferrales bacterium]